MPVMYVKRVREVIVELASRMRGLLRLVVREKWRRSLGCMHLVENHRRRRILAVLGITVRARCNRSGRHLRDLGSAAWYPGV